MSNRNWSVDITPLGVQTHVRLLVSVLVVQLPDAYGRPLVSLVTVLHVKSSVLRVKPNVLRRFMRKTLDK